MDAQTQRVLLECETVGFEEATEKVEALADAYDGFPAQVQIRGCNHCTFNIYPSQTKFISRECDEDDEEQDTERGGRNVEGRRGR